MKVDVDVPRAAVAEAVGTALLVAVVVGSGIMASNLAGDDKALALLANTIATGAGLVALIVMWGGISGAHFNPVVSVVAVVTKTLPLRALPAYVGAQLVGGVAGTALAHAMFGHALLAISSHERATGGELIGEVVATFGLVAVVVTVARGRPVLAPVAVACWIVAAYWFTSSTSFANPAVTVARALTDTFAGIAPASVPGFVVAQVVGAALAVVLFRWLLPREET